MRQRRLIFSVATLAVLFGLLWNGSRQTVFANDYPLAQIEPVTIPLWGPTWDHYPLTYTIEANRGVSDAALQAVQDAIDDWNHAISTNFPGRQLNPGSNPLNTFTNTFLVPAQSGQTPDMIVRPKSGGGSVQGQALASTDANGFFSNCKVNVSGKAFGSTNDADTVRSIAIQEIGHCLGLLHADNSQDPMYGTLQDPPNTQISECDVKGWDAVMAWLAGGVADLPTADHVSCGTNGGGSSGLPDAVAVSTDKPEYQNRETATITVEVLDSNNNPVDGAQVTVELTTANGRRLAASGSTNSQGIFRATYKVNAKRDGVGEYVVDAEACQGGTCANGSASFVVN